MSTVTGALTDQVIIVDNDPEYISGVMVAWAEKLGIALKYIQPIKP